MQRYFNDLSLVRKIEFASFEIDLKRIITFEIWMNKIKDI